jgi:dethiobiotin synthetase
MARLFVAGIGTDVGKTLVSAILCEALHADYWKPVQAGNLDDSDSMKVAGLVTNPKIKIHDETFRLKEAISPHAAALHENIEITAEAFKIPSIAHDLVIEAAGGVMVPLSSRFLVLDLIEQLDSQVVLVSKNYLGSINHTLLTAEALHRRKIPVLGIVFNGAHYPEGEAVIKERSELPMIGRLEEELSFTKDTVLKYAPRFRQTMHFVLRRKSIE